MICLTGDVHQTLLNSEEQKFLKSDECTLAKEYSKIAKKYNIKATLFFTGEAIKENPKIAKEISEMQIEIGGHTYKALRPKWLHYYFKIFLGSSYGPKFYQKRDIRKTLRIIEETTGKEVVSWRTHSYASDSKTYKILKDFGIKIISDEVASENIIAPHNKEKPVKLPINVLRDHGHIYHGPRTKELVKNSQNPGDPFNRKSYTINKWLNLIKKQIERIDSKRGIATMQIHPICMEVADSFETFRKLCRWINKKNIETLLCKEVPKKMEDLY